MDMVQHFLPQNWKKFLQDHEKNFSIIMNNIKSGLVTLLTKALITQSFVNTSLTVLFLHWTEFYFRDIGNCIYLAFFVRTSVKYR